MYCYAIIDAIGCVLDIYFLEMETSPLIGITEENIELIANISYELTFTIVGLILLVFMMVFSTVGVYADNKSDLKDVQNEIEQKEEELEKGKKEEKRLAREKKKAEKIKAREELNNVQ